MSVHVLIFLLATALTAASPASALEENETDALSPHRASSLCSGSEGLVYFAEPNLLCSSGPIDPQGKLEREIRALPLREGVTLVMSSPGGGMMSAISIANYLSDFDYRIVVDGVCASACAQFIFLGADTKYILENGAVAVHGGPLSADQIAAMEVADETKQSLLREQEAFRTFYRNRGVDLALTTDAPASVLARIATGEVVFWMPTRTQFARYGVRNIVYVDSKFHK